MHGKIRNEYKILVGKDVGIRPLGILWYNLEDNIKSANKYIACDDVDSIQKAQDRVQRQTLENVALKLQVL
jgi:hypothetical protein